MRKTRMLSLGNKLVKTILHFCLQPSPFSRNADKQRNYEGEASRSGFTCLHQLMVSF